MEIINYDLICRCEGTPFTLPEMISYHGMPVLQHEENNGIMTFFITFPDKITIVLDISVIKAIFDADDYNWHKVIKSESFRIQFYREIVTNYVGFYAYLDDSKLSEIFVEKQIFFLTKTIRLNIQIAIVKKVGNESCNDGVVKINSESNDFLFFNGSLYYLIKSDTDIMVNVENEYNPDGCTNYRLAEILEREKYSLVQYFSKEKEPKIEIERELVLSGERFNISPQINKINAYAFYKNMYIEKVVIPGSIETIGEKAFSCCGRLQEIEFEGVVNDIHSDSFGYSALVNIIIPDGTINDYKKLIPQCSNKLIEKRKYVPINIDTSVQQKQNETDCHLFAVNFDNKTGYINNRGEIVISALFSFVLGSFYEINSKIIARSNEGWHIVDINGNMTSIDLEGKGTPIRLLANRYLILEKGWNLHALYDIDENRYSVDFGVYDYMWNYSSQWRALRVRKGNKWGVIRTDGAVILPPKYTKVILKEECCLYSDNNERYKRLYFINHELYQPNINNFGDNDYEKDTWNAMTDGMYGDYPNVDTDFEFMGE